MVRGNYLITFLGAEGSGKTTVARHVAQKLGGIALIVPEWPSLGQFITNPDRYALQSQQEALQTTMGTYHRARQAHTGKPLCMDMDPTRIRIHSQVLQEQGYLTGPEWAALDAQCLEASSQWPRHYVYLRTSVGTLLERLGSRGRVEDAQRNAPAIVSIHTKWEAMIVNPSWRAGKEVLDIDNTQHLDHVIGHIVDWTQNLPACPVRPTIEP